MGDAGTFLAIAAVSVVVVSGTVLRGCALPPVVALCVVGFAASGAEALSWLWFVIILPVLTAATLAGWLLRALPFRRAWVLPVGVTVIALVVAAVLAGRRAALDPVPGPIAAQLPGDTGALAALCFDELPAADRRAARREARVLARELSRRPDGLMTVRFDAAESDGYVDEQYTLRELALETLERSSCASPEATSLRQALAAAK